MPAPNNADIETLLRNARDAIDACLQLIAKSGGGGGSSKASGAQGGGKKGASKSQGKSAQFDDVREVFIQEVMNRTGYPEEMLELDLDLEGELGIDTVKQVAILGAVREHYGLDVDKSFKLRDHNTPRKVISYIAGRLKASSPASRA